MSSEAVGHPVTGLVEGELAPAGQPDRRETAPGLSLIGRVSSTPFAANSST
ncbi:hypothetical protein ACFH04_42000 [Streptomyces noboritoensis]|uniref:Uncharacterized protein n=1 Tax=Streptomyces noboritoensis TaxID=67337 RepID=A0ABV6U0J3_9ACTN